MDIFERVRYIRKNESPSMSQTKFGESIGLSRDMVNNIENKRVVPTDAILQLISMKYKYNFEWVKFGEGPERLDVSDDEVVDELMAGSNEYARSVMKAFAKLGDEEWDMLKKVLDKLRENGL